VLSSSRSCGRTVTKKGKKTVDVYLTTYNRYADPAALPAWVRSHWEIENCFHWVRDVTYLEDKSPARTGNAPRVMTPLRSVAISLLRLDSHANIAAANRYHARDPQRTLSSLRPRERLCQVPATDPSARALLSCASSVGVPGPCGRSAPLPASMTCTTADGDSPPVDELAANNSRLREVGSVRRSVAAIKVIDSNEVNSLDRHRSVLNVC
jgi:hypothetical protein